MRRGVIQKVVTDGQTKNKINREFCFAVKLPNNCHKIFYLFRKLSIYIYFWVASTFKKCRIKVLNNYSICKVIFAVINIIIIIFRFREYFYLTYIKLFPTKFRSFERFWRIYYVLFWLKNKFLRQIIAI